MYSTADNFWDLAASHPDRIALVDESRTTGPQRNCLQSAIVFPKWHPYPGTVGRAMPLNEARILDSERNTVRSGTVGRVYLRESEFNRFEYKGAPAKMAACRVGDFVTVGDIGYLNEAGYLFLCDRREI